ncbi:uncharacterized protein LOC127858078 [Dreissena polymorpha]|uniref:F-box domain-containing protein n=1 Tax=Dreissena polymorpha TaxID=45954 RepID=A0A9D3Z230_DREPO|nr:uncharacterized protein LOC127858078 [Dreissena polymorpha]KAH3708749.1 hypothetical protein DPMN_068208 [Dreissena polymorpha]
MPTMSTKPVPDLEEDCMVPSWQSLPDHVLLQIFSYLTASDLAKTGLVCKGWLRVAFDELLWKDLFYRHWGISRSIAMAPGKYSWIQEYKRLLYHTPSVESEVLKQHADQVLHVSFSHNGKMFATCSKDGFIRVWDSTYPTSIKYKADMKKFTWKYTQYSQFNSSDTLLLVSGVHFGSLSTSGEIAVFSLEGEFVMQSRMMNKPYDVFGTWYSDCYLLSGNLHWTGHLNSCSAIWLNKAYQETVSEEESVVMRLFKFSNINASSIRTIMVADCLTEERQGLSAEERSETGSMENLDNESLALIGEAEANQEQEDINKPQEGDQSKEIEVKENQLQESAHNAQKVFQGIQVFENGEFITKYLEVDPDVPNASNKINGTIKYSNDYRQAQGPKLLSLACTSGYTSDTNGSNNGNCSDTNGSVNGNGSGSEVSEQSSESIWNLEMFEPRSEAVGDSGEKTETDGSSSDFLVPSHSYQGNQSDRTDSSLETGSSHGIANLNINLNMPTNGNEDDHVLSTSGHHGNVSVGGPSVRQGFLYPSHSGNFKHNSSVSPTSSSVSFSLSLDGTSVKDAGRMESSSSSQNVLPSKPSSDLDAVSANQFVNFVRNSAESQINSNQLRSNKSNDVSVTFNVQCNLSLSDDEKNKKPVTKSVSTVKHQESLDDIGLNSTNAAKRVLHWQQPNQGDLLRDPSTGDLSSGSELEQGQSVGQGQGQSLSQVTVSDSEATQRDRKVNFCCVDYKKKKFTPSESFSEKHGVKSSLKDKRADKSASQTGECELEMETEISGEAISGVESADSVSSMGTDSGSDILPVKCLPLLLRSPKGCDSVPNNRVNTRSRCIATMAQSRLCMGGAAFSQQDMQAESNQEINENCLPVHAVCIAGTQTFSSTVQSPDVLQDMGLTLEVTIPKPNFQPKISKSKSKSKQNKDKYLIFTKGSETYTPHQIGIKRIKPLKAFDKDGSRLLPNVADTLHNVEQPDSYDRVDHLIDMHGHIIGMALSPDQRYLYVNSRPWPKNYFIENPLYPPPIAQEIDIHVIDLLNMREVGTMHRAHKAYTSNDECFFIFLDVCEEYVASGAEDKHGYLWDRHYGLCLHKYPHTDVVNSVAFNPADPEVLITVSDDFSIKIWRSLSREKEVVKAFNKEHSIRLKHVQAIVSDTGGEYNGSTSTAQADQT